MKKFNPSTLYGKGEVVEHNGKQYKAIATIIGKHPTDTNYWQPHSVDKKPIVLPKDTRPDAPINIVKKKEYVAPEIRIVNLPGRTGERGNDGRHGRDGVDGTDGRGLEFQWDGTKLGVRRENDSSYQFVDLAPAVKNFTPAGHNTSPGSGSTHYRLYSVPDTGLNLIKAATQTAGTLKKLVAGNNVTLADNGSTITIGQTSGTDGTLTNFSFTNANNISGVVTNPTTTPNLTLSLDAINSNVGSFGTASQVGQFTATATGQITAATNVPIVIASTAVNDFTEASQDAVGAAFDTTLVYVDGSNLITRGAITGDIAIPQASNTSTLATVNSNVGSFGTASQVGQFTVNGKGLITAASNVPIAVTSSAITDFNEAAQDAIGLMVDTTLVYVDGTPLLTRAALTGDITAPQASNATTLATVNTNVGSFGSATQVATFTVNGKGLTTAAGNVTVTPAVGSITGLGTGVATALGVNVGTAGAFVVNGGALGTPSSGVATNLTGTASGLTAGAVTNATFTTALTVNTGTLTLTANAANTSVLTIGAGASSISGSNTGDQTITLTGAVTGSGIGSFATTLATPGTLTVSTTNSNATAHTHAITSSSAPGAAASLLATDASGIIGSTGTRIVKGWFTDLTVTNAISGSVTGNAGTVTNATLTTALTVNTGTVTLTGNVANTSVLTIGAGAVSVSGSNTGDQTSVSGNAGTATALQNARTLWGQSFDGTGNITGSQTGIGDMTGGASSMIITAGTGNSRTLTLRSTTSGGVAAAFLTGNADQSSTFGGNISGTGAWNITGGAGNMTIVSGTGNSRTMILQTTTSGGTATTAVTLGADQSAAFAGAISVTGHTTFEGVTSTGATGTGKLVYDGTPTLATPNIGVATASNLKVTSSSIPSEGVYSSAANNLDFSARSLRILNLTTAASSVNYISMAGSATGIPVSIASAGTDADVPWQISTKGAGSLTFYTGGFARAALQLIDTASAVNYLTITEAATGSSASIAASGTDSNLNFLTIAKGTGVLVNAGSNTNTTASAANLNIDASGFIKKNSSSIRYKMNIEDMFIEDGQKILKLRPIWFRSKCDGDNKKWSYNGLLAEEVAALNPRWALWDYLPKDRVYDDSGNMTIREGAELVPDGIAVPGILVGVISLMQQQEKRINELENIIKKMKNN